MKTNVTECSKSIPLLLHHCLATLSFSFVAAYCELITVRMETSFFLDVVLGEVVLELCPAVGATQLEPKLANW